MSMPVEHRDVHDAFTERSLNERLILWQGLVKPPQPYEALFAVRDYVSRGCNVEVHLPYCFRWDADKKPRPAQTVYAVGTNASDERYGAPLADRERHRPRVERRRVIGHSSNRWPVLEDGRAVVERRSGGDEADRPPVL